MQRAIPFSKASDISVSNVQAVRELIRPYIRQTPILELDLPQVDGKHWRIFSKCELFQRGGSFKLRGALSSALLNREAGLKNGITAVSAGNHAIAVAYAAKLLGMDAKIVMPKLPTNQFRIERCQELGATVVLANSRDEAFRAVSEIAKNEGRHFIHPFDAVPTILGAATLGLDIAEEMNDRQPDVVLVPVGGGGLISGLSIVLKHFFPRTRIIGVEPETAALMLLSRRTGVLQKSLEVASVADSLTPPMVGELCFSICQEFVDELVTVSDEKILEALSIWTSFGKLAVEPASAAALAGFYEIASEIPQQGTVLLIASGSNIDSLSYATFLNSRSSTLG